MKAIIYTRGSNKEEQESICRRYAQERGIEIVATSIENEPIENLAEADAMIVTDFARLSRNQRTALFILDELRKCEIELHIVNR